MATEYRIDLLSTAGVKVAELTGHDGRGFLGLEYSKKVNDIGAAAFTVDGASPALAFLGRRTQVQVYRRNRELGINWTRDWDGFLVKREQRTRQSTTVKFSALSTAYLLNDVIVAYRAETVNRSMFSSVAAETVLKTLTSYNAGTLGTLADGRIRQSGVSGFTVGVATDLARGNVVSFACAYDNLFAALKDVARIAGGDFDLLRTSGTTFSLEFYLGQLGTNRSTTVVFALEYGNMRDPIYVWDDTNTRTVAIVGGQGRDAEREVVATTTALSATLARELFVNASNSKTTAALTSEGNANLYSSRTRETLDYAVIQTAASAYGRDYFLGDIVRSVYGPVNITQKITGIKVGFDAAGSENIDVELETQ